MLLHVFSFHCRGSTLLLEAPTPWQALPLMLGVVGSCTLLLLHVFSFHCRVSTLLLEAPTPWQALPLMLGVVGSCTLLLLHVFSFHCRVSTLLLEAPTPWQALPLLLGVVHAPYSFYYTFSHFIAGFLHYYSHMLCTQVPTMYYSTCCPQKLHAPLACYQWFMAAAT